MNTDIRYKSINYLLLALISIIWGSQFLFNKIALPYFATGEIAFFRSFIGMLVLSMLLLFIPKTGVQNHQNYSPVTFQIKTFIIGFFEATAPFLLIVWGQQYVDSAVTSILISTIPIFTIAITICLPRENFTLGNILSVIIGFIAIMVLLAPGTSQTDALINIPAAVAILGGAFSFAVSIILIRQLPPVPPIVSARNILFWASVQLLPVALWQSNYTFADVGLTAWSAILFLGVFCGGIVYLFFVLLVQRAGATFTALSNYLLPFVGVGLGVTVFQETLSQYALLAMALIILALVANEVFSKKIKEVKSSP
jgi:drug/metabolite transporter (DMT)-like permease